MKCGNQRDRRSIRVMNSRQVMWDKMKSGLTAHSCEKCISTDVWGGEEGVLGNNDWLSGCLSLV